MTKRLLVALPLFCASMFAARLLYQMLVVPELEDVKRVPYAWWVGCASPFIVSGLVFGWLARSIRELLALATVGCLAYLVLDAFGSSGAHDLPPGLAAGILHRAIGIALLFAAILGLVLVGWVPGHLNRRRRAA